MTRGWIGLGANLGDPPAQLREALTRLADIGDVIAVSPFYRSAPMGPADQPDYCNAVCELVTAAAPIELMRQLLAIERQMGRLRGIKWGPRTIDLDLLHVEGATLAGVDLQLPHPGIAQRNFVLTPLADIAPELVIPGVGRVQDAARQLGTAGLQRWTAT